MPTDRFTLLEPGPVPSGSPAGSDEYDSEEPVGDPCHAHRVDVTLRSPSPSSLAVSLGVRLVAGRERESAF